MLIVRGTLYTSFQQLTMTINTLEHMRQWLMKQNQQQIIDEFGYSHNKLSSRLKLHHASPL